ncbi:MAG: LytB [bacterium]
MEYVFLKHDGRCKWLENKILKGYMPTLLKKSWDPFGKKIYVIRDWLTNDGGRVGVDLQWLKSLGVPVVDTLQDLSEGMDYIVVNTGYDSIVHEEKQLRERGIEIIDLPCPFIRAVRRIFESADEKYQYVFLCESNHLLIKNYASLFPKDMILVQMANYRERIAEQSCGKPMYLIPYVTFLPVHALKIFDYIKTIFPYREHRMKETYCMWVKSSSSPIREIEELDQSLVKEIDEALVITTPGSTNKSLVSLFDVLENRGLKVKTITSLKELLRYEKYYKNVFRKVLIVRSPIPNKAEKPIMAYLKQGLPKAYWEQIRQSYWYRKCTIGLYGKTVYYARLLTGIIRGKYQKDGREIQL